MTNAESLEQRIAAGRATLESLRGDAPTSVLDEVAEIAPDFRDYVHGFVYGEIFRRPGLPPRDRIIVTLSCLVALGGLDGPIELYVGIALGAGLTPEEIVEVLLQCVSLAGFPRVQNALFLARKVFVQRGLEPPPIVS